MTELERAVLQAAEAYVEHEQRGLSVDHAEFDRWRQQRAVLWLALLNAVEQYQAVQGPGGQQS